MNRAARAAIAEKSRTSLSVPSVDLNHSARRRCGAWRRPHPLQNGHAHSRLARRSRSLPVAHPGGIAVAHAAVGEGSNHALRRRRAGGNQARLPPPRHPSQSGISGVTYRPHSAWIHAVSVARCPTRHARSARVFGLRSYVVCEPKADTRPCLSSPA